VAWATSVAKLSTVEWAEQSSTVEWALAQSSTVVLLQALSTKVQALVLGLLAEAT
jgi:hypothetical protein